MNSRLTLFCFLFQAGCVFSQTQLYRSEQAGHSETEKNVYNSITLVGNAVIVNTSNYRLKALNKDNYQELWDIDVGTASNTSPYFYNDSFFHPTKKGERNSMALYDLKTGKMIKELPFESIWSKPHFLGSTMYFMGAMDGSRLLAYDIDNNETVWERQIGLGGAPVFLKDKIIAEVDEKQWTEMDYKGKQLTKKTKESVIIDTTKYNISNYEFPTHDGKKITGKFLSRKKISNWDFTKEVTEKHTVLLGDRRLLILGDRRRVVLNLDLETIISPDLEDNYAVSKMVKMDDETIWLACENHLVHYNFKKKKLLRNVNLTHWQPYQLVLDGRDIWLISKNDGQLYHLDFEPDKAVAEKTAREKAIQKQLRCDPPNPEKIKAAKDAEERLKNNN